MHIYYSCYNQHSSVLGLKVYSQEEFYNFIDGKDVNPILKFQDCLNEKFFEILLTRNETYFQDDDYEVVTIQSKLIDVYQVIFVTGYLNNQYATSIGECEFNKNTKKWLLEIAELFSSYTNL